MKSHFRRSLSCYLVLMLLFQILGSRQFSSVALASPFLKIEEGRTLEDVLAEEHIEENRIHPEYIIENLIYEDGLYEFQLSENIISQAYIIEATVGVTTIEQILDQLPAGIDEYAIDWPSVIAKFAVGTAIIIAVGVISCASEGSTYFVFGSPVRVAKDALIGGAIGAALNTLIQCMANGEVVDAAVLKYSIEGFADGYMWGAISSVLRIANENYRRLREFRAAAGGSLRIKFDGSVFNDAGRAIGKAYYSSDQIWYLVDNATDVVRLFDKGGTEIVGASAERYLLQSASGLPANTTLRLGTDSNYKVCRTDSSGKIFRINDELKPNIRYELNGYTYTTDSFGRIQRAEFDDLINRPKGRGRLEIEDSKSAIGRGEWRLDDERGHVIADRFGGDNTMANIVPQSKYANHGVISEIENEMAIALNEGKRVSGSIELSYSGSSYRPTEFTYSYDIGDGMIVTHIKN